MYHTIFMSVVLNQVVGVLQLFFFFFKIAVVIPGLLYAHVNFQMCLSICRKKPCQGYNWDCTIFGELIS